MAAATGAVPSSSGSGSGSGSDDSSKTVRQGTPQPEATTFTFSSKRSPFIHTSPPGAATFTSSANFPSALRRGSDAPRDRTHRRQPGAPQAVLPPGWIPLRPLQAVDDGSLPIFTARKPPPQIDSSNTAVFAARSPESRATRTRHTPRLSLVAQHHHATSRHPFFDAPPQLVTPSPQDPFVHLASPDSYFPPILPPTQSRSSSTKPKRSSEKSQTSSKHSSSKHTSSKQPSSTKQPSTKQPDHSSRSSSRAHTAKPSSSRHAPRTPSLFLTGPKPGPQPPPSIHIDSSALHVPPSPTATPRQGISRSPKSDGTPPEGSAAQPPSIAIFRDCFGVLTATENVFPARTSAAASRRSTGSGSGSYGSEAGSGSAGGGRGTEFQRRWTKRWLRRTMRGVGNMGSGGSGSGSSVDGIGSRKGKTRSTGGNSSRILLGSRTHSSGSQDSLDRVRVSRSDAGSPSGSSGGATPLEIQSRDLSDVDEGEGEGGDSPEAREVDGGSHMQQMMNELGPTVAPEVAPVAG